MKETPFSSNKKNIQPAQTPKPPANAQPNLDPVSDKEYGYDIDPDVWDEQASALSPRAGEPVERRSNEQADTQRRSAAVWQMALSELALSMPGPTYETWVRDTSVMGYEDGEFVIGVPNAYARDWLQNRLRPQIKRILSKLLQRSTEVTFRVRPRPSVDPEPSDTPPLYQPLDGARMHPDSRFPQASNEDNSRPGERRLPSAEDYWGESEGEEDADPQNSEHDFRTSNRYQPTPPPSERGRSKSRPAPQTANLAMQGTPLNSQYTFDTFVVGSHNRLAHAAALSVAEQPGYRFNPLFIYGGVGLGKTHLLHAIGHQMLNRNLRVLYCSSEQFTNDLISAIRSQSTEEFRNKYRQVDLLLIDDIQFIGGKESTQEEFFHTFNHLHAANRQVVISSDRPPKDIATLEARLRSRFEGGLQADISVPDLETRVAILQSKAHALGVHVDQDVLMLVAERVEKNIRELEGALNRLIVQSPLKQQRLDRRTAEEILNDLMPQRRPREASSVVALVAAHFSLTVADLLGRARTKEVAFARQIAMYLLREENGLSLPGIGDQLGGRDHSTVRYGVEKVAADVETDEATRRHVVALREKIYAPPGSF